MSRIINLLAAADETYAQLPPRVELEVERLRHSLNDHGLRRLRKAGAGTEFFEVRPFRPESDERRKIHARKSAQAGKLMVVDKESEIRQHFYLWRDGSDSMNYKSAENLLSKKESAEVMMLALARYLARHEDAIGMMDSRGAYTGSYVAEALSGALEDVTIIAGNLPQMQHRLPRHSTIVLFSDFFADSTNLEESLASLSGQTHEGYAVMLLDPEEVDFTFKGNKEFHGMEGEGSINLHAESVRDDFRAAMRRYSTLDLPDICARYGFRLIIQRTDRPLYEGLGALLDTQDYNQALEAPKP